MRVRIVAATDADEPWFSPALPYRIRQRLGPVINRLQAAGFRWAPFSLYHRPPVGTNPDGSWTYRPSSSTRGWPAWPPRRSA